MWWFFLYINPDKSVQGLRLIRAHLFSHAGERKGRGSYNWDVLRSAYEGRDPLDVATD